MAPDPWIERMLDDRERQGFPRYLEDPEALETIATIVFWERRRQQYSRNRKTAAAYTSAAATENGDGTTELQSEA